MTASPSLPAPSRMTATAWLICIIASIGFAFDIYELLMLPLILRPALLELGQIQPGTAEFSKWFSLMFYVPAFAGGLFGLLGGYLTDRLGRRRVLTWSILLYAGSAFLAGFTTSLPALLVLRCTTFIGVCVEFVAAVAWLAEMFPNPQQREKVLGYTQAFSSIGGVMVAFANGLAVKYSASLPEISWHIFGEIHEVHAPWRYTLMSGLIPAIPLILIRPFLPESPAWQMKKEAGTLRRPSFAELFSPKLMRTTIVSTLMIACAYGAAFGAIQQMPQIVPGLPEVTSKIKEQVAALPKTAPAASPASAPATAPAKAPPPDPRAKTITGKVVQETAATATKIQEIGGLFGRVALAVLAVYIISRRKLIRLFQIPGLIVMPITFAYCATTGLNLLHVGMFIAGFLTVGQLTFWGNYLPRVYPLHLRGTGESFAANIGGRMIGTSFAALTAMTAAALAPANPTPVQAAHITAYVAAGVGTFVYLLGFILSFFLPEPKPELAED